MPGDRAGPVQRDLPDRGEAIRRGPGIGHMLDIRAVLIRGAGSAGLVYAAGAGVVFGLHVLLSRLMGVEHYGVYVYVLSWINILVLFGKMGLDTALLRYVAAGPASRLGCPLPDP